MVARFGSGSMLAVKILLREKRVVRVEFQSPPGLVAPWYPLHRPVKKYLGTWSGQVGLAVCGLVCEVLLPCTASTAQYNAYITCRDHSSKVTPAAFKVNAELTTPGRVHVASHFAYRLHLLVKVPWYITTYRGDVLLCPASRCIVTGDTCIPS